MCSRDIAASPWDGEDKAVSPGMFLVDLLSVTGVRLVLLDVVTPGVGVLQSPSLIFLFVAAFVALLFGLVCSIRFCFVIVFRHQLHSFTGVGVLGAVPVRPRVRLFIFVSDGSATYL